MNTKKFPLATTSWDEEEYQAIEDVVRSGFFTMGPKVNEFEREFSNFFGSKYSVMVNSGSSANLLMIAALFFRKESPLKRGDEVIVPAVSWSTTYFPLQQYGLKVKFVDIDLKTLNFDLTKLDNAITDKTRLIFAVNLLGNPNDFDEIKRIIQDKNIILLEDNCESMGAEYKGKMAGTIGLMGSFSCFFSHHISTMEGGIISTDDEEIYHILLCLRAHGWTRNLPKNNRVTGTKSDNGFVESFRFVLPGYNVRPLEMSGAIGVQQLLKLEELIRERRSNALIYQDSIYHSKNLIGQTEIETSSWFGFSLIIKNPKLISRDNLISIVEANGFECRPIVAGNFANNSVVSYFDYEISGDLDNANHLDQHGLFIGNQHYDISDGLKALFLNLNKC